MIATPAALPKVADNRASFFLASAGTILVWIVTVAAQAQGNGPLDIYAEDSQPRREPAATAFPKYPDDALQERREGETTVCFRIDRRGEIIRPRVRSSTHRAFEKPAMVALRASTFTPLEAGEPQSTAEVCRVYRFKLTPISAPTAETLEEAPVLGVVASASTLSPSANAPSPIDQRGPETDGTVADARAETEPPELLVVTGTKSEPDPAEDRVCEQRKRPGSMIAATICYSREEQLALERVKERTLSDIEQEQH